MEAADRQAERIVTAFERIRDTRMDGVAIVNPALDVRMTEFHDLEAGRLAVLVTPWFINAILLTDYEDGNPARQGEKRSFALPAGPFEFIYGHEDEIGGHWMCSLFSPVFEFGDADTAGAAAQAALEALLDAENAEQDEDADMRAMWRGEAITTTEEEADVTETVIADETPPDVTRRAFLTAGQGGKP